MKRNVLITGASSGIGKAIAYVFAANGDNIIITGRRLDKLEEIKQDIEKQYHVQYQFIHLMLRIWNKRL